MEGEKGVRGGINTHRLLKIFVVTNTDLLTTTWSVNDYEMFFLGKTGISGVCLVYHLAGTERLVINCLVV